MAVAGLGHALLLDAREDATHSSPRSLSPIRDLQASQYLKGRDFFLPERLLDTARCEARAVKQTLTRR